LVVVLVGVEPEGFDASFIGALASELGLAASTLFALD
jgi:hypothetical protein